MLVLFCFNQPRVFVIDVKDDGTFFIFSTILFTILYYLVSDVRRGGGN